MKLTLHVIVLLLCVGLFIQSNAYAQENAAPTKADRNTEKAEQFFQECLQKPVIDLSDETDQAFCACAALNMKNWLDIPVQDRRNAQIFESLEEKQLDADTLLVEIYGSCLHIPVYEMTYDDCLDSRSARYQINQPGFLDGLCQCIAVGQSDYFRAYAQPFLEMAMAEDRIIYDPVKAIKSDKNYYAAERITEKNCYFDYLDLQEKFRQEEQRRRRNKYNGSIITR